MHNSFSFGRIRNIEIKIHYSWFLILFLVVWSLADFYFPANYPGWSSSAYWISGGIAAALLFISVLLHELSHSLVGKRKNIIVKSITLFVFGGVAEMVTEPKKPSDEFDMAIAGPILSIILAGIFWFISGFEIGVAGAAITNYLFLINGILAVFNMVPAFPLDGGRIFRSALWAKYKDIERATRRAVGVSRFIAFLFTLWGLKMLLDNDFLGGLWIILISWFLLQAAGSSLKQQRMEEVLSRFKIDQIMEKDFKSVPRNMTLKDLGKAFLDYKQGGFPVEENDKLLGIITIEDLRQVPRTKWAKTAVGEVMTSADKLLTIRSADTAYDAFLKMASNEFGRLPVVENEKVVGLVTRNSIILLLAVKCDNCI
ncbi:site-2 protease family protein [Candidatus Falkowbacteria bacterium]|nr:site-2 protease family protein [Candidatus Falkowbacteria bacterium]